MFVCVHSVEEFLAQEKQRLSQAASSQQPASFSPPKSVARTYSAPGNNQSETSPLSARLGESQNGEFTSPGKLPLIRGSSGASAAPSSARAGSSKDDLSGTTGGRFPPISAHRSGSNSRNGSSGNLNSTLRGISGSNLLASTSIDACSDMDVESPQDPAGRCCGTALCERVAGVCCQTYYYPVLVDVFKDTGLMQGCVVWKRAGNLCVGFALIVCIICL
jgi:hypothetical protein